MCLSNPFANPFDILEANEITIKLLERRTKLLFSTELLPDPKMDKMLESL